VEFLGLAAQSGFSLDRVSTSSTKICVSFIFRCALIFVDTYVHTLFLEVNFVFHFTLGPSPQIDFTADQITQWQKEFTTEFCVECVPRTPYL
jgi:hypothetical protein